MTGGVGITVLAILTASAAILLFIREIHLRSLNARVSNAVLGVPDRSLRSQDLTSWFSSVGMRYSRFYGEENLEQLKVVLQSSGLNHYRTLPIWVGVKTVSTILFPLTAFALAQFMGGTSSDVVIFTLTGVVIGIMGPRLILLMLKRRFDAAVKAGTPDTIDLLVVCSEAGMGLESAIQRVADEINETNSGMARVLHSLLDDLRMLPNRADAFERLGSKSEGLRRFGTVVSQSLQYGTPLSQALRTIAADLRRERITKLEERAHKLGVKLTIPMVLFLLPAMFVILGGSPFLHLIRAFQ